MERIIESRLSGHPETQRAAIRIMLLHGRESFRASLAGLLAAERDFEVVAKCANVIEGLEALRAIGEGVTEPDVVLLEFSIWQDLIGRVRDAGYKCKFLTITDEIDAAHCARALSGGISGVFVGSDSPVRLMQAIRIVASGEVWVDRSVIQLLANRYPQHEDLRLEGLVERERAVLDGILGGLTNRKIADQNGLSEATVKATVQNLFQKTGVRTRSQLVRIMLDGSR